MDEPLAGVVAHLEAITGEGMLLEVKDLQTHLNLDGRIIKAVDGASFEIREGETFCLVGESGSGKSMVALSIMQLLPGGLGSHPGGQVLFQYRHGDGRSEQVDMLTLPEERRREIRGARIAMIFQEPMASLNPVFTIGDQIIEALQLHHPGMRYGEARRLAIEALAQVQIPAPGERIDEYPHRLSGGQCQRVMIAMAMACESDLLIADEPTTALDTTVQAEILRLMKTLQDRRGTSILLITHDFGVVAEMANRLAVMQRGKLVETGTLTQVLHNPQQDYTRSLLAALPQNLVKQCGGQQEVYPGLAQEEGARERYADGPASGKKPMLLELQDLAIHFPIRKGILRRTVASIRAVDGVDLQIPAGQILALVGESGCGKTTLGRGVLRLIEPTGGTIRFLGQDITRLPRSRMRPYRRQMQIIFQNPLSSLNPRLTIATILTEPLVVHGIGADQEERLEIARQTLSRVHLEDRYLWRYPHELSGGQRQRIGIARALALDPSIVICDEITSSLDLSVQAEILQLLLEFRRERHLTLLFITHNMGVVEYISDEMAVMYAGKIVEKGPTARVCRDPHHPYTQQLLGAVLHIPL
jgi:peptide/nickel transport system ATP-binding protein